MIEYWQCPDCKKVISVDALDYKDLQIFCTLECVGWGSRHNYILIGSEIDRPVFDS